jgi:hypothetical protein
VTGLSPFADDIRALVAGLRGGAPTHARVNGAAAGIDHLGRRLHGLGFLRDGEIAGCFTAAVNELGACHPLPEEDRRTAVDSAIRHLEAAATHAQEGVLPPPPTQKLMP